MSDDKQVTAEEARALRKKAEEASSERDVAVDAAMQAMGNEAEAKEEAREQHTEALSAQAQADGMNTLRHVASVRADSEARSGNRARFMLYLLTAGILAAFVVVVVWLSVRW